MSGSFSGLLPRMSLPKCIRPIDDYKELGEDDIRLLTVLLSHGPTPLDKLGGFVPGSRNDMRLSQDEKLDLGVLCNSHMGLRAPLMENILDFVMKEMEGKIEKTLHTLSTISGFLENEYYLDSLAPFRWLGQVAGMWQKEDDFTTVYPDCKPHPLYAYQKDGCAACILSRMGAVPEILIALRASMILWMPSQYAARSKRIEWVESWINNCDKSNVRRGSEIRRESDELVDWVRGKLNQAKSLKDARKAKPTSGNHILAMLMRRSFDDDIKTLSLQRLAELKKRLDSSNPTPRWTAYASIPGTANGDASSPMRNLAPTDIPITVVPALPTDHPSFPGRNLRPRAESAAPTYQGTVFIDQDSENSDFKLRHRNPDNTPFGPTASTHTGVPAQGNNSGTLDWSALDNSMGGGRSEAPNLGATVEDAEDYVPPRSDWARIRRAEDFNEPAIGHGYLSGYAGDEPAGRCLSPVASLSNYGGTPSELLASRPASLSARDTLDTVRAPSALRVNRQRSRGDLMHTAQNRAEAYQNLIGANDSNRHASSQHPRRGTAAEGDSEGLIDMFLAGLRNVGRQ